MTCGILDTRNGGRPPAVTACLTNHWRVHMATRKRTTAELQARILRSCTQQPNGCWIWNLAKYKTGYGRFGHHEYAHRISYAAFVGEILEGMHVLHQCDVPACVNPGHLFLGDDQDNCADMIRKGRGRKLADGAVRGVEKHGKRFYVRLSITGTLVMLGSFSTKDEAAAVSQAARARLYGVMVRTEIRTKSKPQNDIAALKVA